MVFVCTRSHQHKRTGVQLRVDFYTHPVFHTFHQSDVEYTRSERRASTWLERQQERDEARDEEERARDEDRHGRREVGVERDDGGLHEQKDSC